MPPAAKKKQVQRSYSAEQIRDGLTALALCNGNGRQAQKLLKDFGTEIPHRTLTDWRAQVHADEYQQVQRGVLDRLKERTAEKHMQMAERRAEVADLLLGRLEDEVDKIPPRDLSGALRNVDVGIGIHQTKAAELRGDPAVVEQHHKYPELIRSMRSMGIVVETQPAIDVPSTEVPEATEKEE